MLPTAQASCTPSVPQTKSGVWLGIQPFSTHTCPAGHIPCWLRGTHVPATQTLAGLMQSFVMVQPWIASVQMPRAVSQPNPLVQSLSVAQAAVHFPATHLLFAGHCV